MNLDGRVATRFDEFLTIERSTEVNLGAAIPCGVKGCGFCVIVMRYVTAPSPEAGLTLLGCPIGGTLA